MPHSGENIRFQCLINGEVKGTTAVESKGVLTVVIDWVRRDLADAPQELRAQTDFNEQEWIGNEAGIVLGGMDSATNEYLDWFKGSLRVGDEVTIRILPPGKFDSPTERRISTCGVNRKEAN
jgi:hypothetical protein